MKKKLLCILILHLSPTPPSFPPSLLSSSLPGGAGGAVRSYNESAMRPDSGSVRSPAVCAQEKGISVTRGDRWIVTPLIQMGVTFLRCPFKRHNVTKVGRTKVTAWRTSKMKKKKLKRKCFTRVGDWVHSDTDWPYVLRHRGLWGHKRFCFH